MKLISWNVNGLRAVVKKNFYEVFAKLQPDFFCLQETKLQANQITMDLPDYYEYWHYAEKKATRALQYLLKKRHLMLYTD